MAMEVHGHIISSPFVFVCDGKVYRSHSASNWTVVFSRYGTQAWGHDTYGTQRVDRACPPNRNSEVLSAFRGAVMRHFNLNYTQIDAFIERQIKEDKQILVEGRSVKLHVGNRSTYTPSVSYRNGKATVNTPAPVQAPVVAKKKKKKPTPEEKLKNITPMYTKNGLPVEDVAECHAWIALQRPRFHGVKIGVAIEAYLTEGKVPTAAAEPEAEKPKKTRKRTLVEEREHKEDVPFYGRRRRNQAQFRADVSLNCGDRCVLTAASAMRCEAAHLVAHARKGGASFKNGLLLRSDIHQLFDLGLCAIDPATLQMYFKLSVLETDADLAQYHGQKLRPMMKPIKADNLQSRWEAFNA
ncbi:HNH endonuclease [Salmonella enterica]